MDLSSLPTLEAPRVLLADVASKMAGSFPTDMTPNVTTATRVIDPDTGGIIAAYYPLDDDVRARLRAAVLRVSFIETYRSASGNRNRSRIFGMSPRKPFQQRESCRPSGLAADQPDEHAVLVDLASRLADDLRAFAPDVAERDAQTIKPVLDEWRMSERSIWTSGVVNKSSTLPYHRDGGNFPVWSAMPVLRRGMDGGALHIPEYDVTLACRDGWVAYFPGWELVHGVTPMRPSRPDGYRYSVVYYALRGMKDCHTYAVETAEGAKRRTAREVGIADGAAGRAPIKITGRRKAET